MVKKTHMITEDISEDEYKEVLSGVYLYSASRSNTCREVIIISHEFSRDGTYKID